MPRKVCKYCGADFDSKLRLNGHVRRCHPYLHLQPAHSTHQSPPRFANTNRSAPHVTSLFNDDYVYEHDDDDYEGDLNFSFENQNGSSMAEKTREFYNQYGDHSQSLYVEVPEQEPVFATLSRTSKLVIMFCLENQLTRGEIKAQYNLMYSVEQGNGPVKRELSNDFVRAGLFLTYVQRFRKSEVRKQRWRKALILSNAGTNETGVFRSTLELLRLKLQENGGLSSLIQFSLSESGNERIFSCPSDSIAMEYYGANLPVTAPIVCIDVFCDGTVLSSTGSQSASLLRVRFSNMKSEQNK